MSDRRKLMHLLFTVLLFAAFAFSSICVSPVYAKKHKKAIRIDEIVVFGDSLSDVGNLWVATLGADETVPLSPPYYEGRFSNGPVWNEYLAVAMNLDVVPGASNLGGTNYAWGGAETGFGLSAVGTPNIGEQINRFLTPDPDDPATFNYPKSSQLFIIWAGANDFNHADTLPEPRDIVANIIEHIRTLALAAPGEKLNFMIPNLPPLGQTPRSQCLASYDPLVPSILDDLSMEFNFILKKELKRLKKELKRYYSIKIVFYKLDIFSLFNEIFADPEGVGFSNITDTVRTGIDASGCPASVADPYDGVVDDADEYLFFDDIHPTTVSHEMIAQKALELINGHIRRPYIDDVWFGGWFVDWFGGGWFGPGWDHWCGGSGCARFCDSGCGSGSGHDNCFELWMNY